MYYNKYLKPIPYIRFDNILKCKKSKLIRNSNPHIRITHLDNIHTLIITVFTVIALFLKFVYYFLFKSKFLVFISSLTAPSFLHKNFFYLN